MCDPNGDGKLDRADYDWWKDEYTGIKFSKNSDCFKSDGVVDILDFQVWKNKFLLGGTSEAPSAPPPIRY
jgi:hypothetical protein